jgi:integrase
MKKTQKSNLKVGTLWFSTKYTGVRYREHPTRKHGVTKDKYFTVRYQRDGKRKNEGVGWASNGMSAEKAFHILGELKQNAKLGEGPTRLKEKREIQKAKTEAINAKKIIEDRENVTFRDYFNGPYLDTARMDKKDVSLKREMSIFKIWLDAEIGNLPFKDISPIRLEKVKSKILNAGRSPKSVEIMLALVRQVFHHARRSKLYIGDVPTHQVKIPKFDNRRLRFLTKDEADILLNTLKRENTFFYEAALLSLHCGLRFGEIVGLTWNDVDLSSGILTIRNTKNTKTRPAFMTDEVKKMLSDKQTDRHNTLVFPRKDGLLIDRVPSIFARIVDKLGFNDGVTDRRQKLVFHSLRHSFASFLVQNGVDLYTVKTLMGHSQISMTERYSHLSQGNLQSAVRTLQNTLGQTETWKQKSRGKSA